MRAVIVLCLAALAVAVAAPQGYNYPSHFVNQYFMPAAGSTFGRGSVHSYKQEPMITKRFFIHSAPEEEAEIEHRNIVVGQPRKNFNVVFIKSPIAAAKKTKVRIVPAANEEKTVIYVLAKKAGENDVVAQVEESYATTAKPEVFFIKYKTNEEAEHAQHTIQAEYDRLGGSSIVSNEGIASVSSVIGSLDGQGSTTMDSNDAGHGVPNSAYLPPGKKL